MSPQAFASAARAGLLSRRTLLSQAGALGLVAGVGGAPAWAQTAPPVRPRLVAVSGAITEVVYALGAQHHLVGTDTTSTHPEAAQHTPKVGYLRQLSAEGLLSLRPDAVVATTEAGPPVVLEQLRSAGVQVSLVPSDYSWEDVRRKVQAVAQITQRQSQSQALLEQLDREWQQTQQQVAQAVAAARAAGRATPRVLFTLAMGPSLQVAGLGTAGDALIRFAGGRNAVGDKEAGGFQGYRPLSAEALSGAAPDCIVATQEGITGMGGPDALWQRPELALTPAYARRALVTLDALQLLGFGPRLPQTVLEIHRQLYA